MKLSRILSKHLAPIKLGLDPEKLKVEQLRRDLEALRRETSSYFALCVALVLVVFAASCWGVLAHLEEAAFVRTTLGLAGLGLFGSFFAMMRLWREKVATDVILSLIPALEPDLTRTVITILANRLR
jgi:hypothetical protein